MVSARGCPGSTCISPVWLERCKFSLSLSLLFSPIRFSPSPCQLSACFSTSATSGSSPVLLLHPLQFYVPASASPSPGRAALTLPPPLRFFPFSL